MYIFVDEKESEAEGLSKLYCAKVTAGRRSKYSQRMLLLTDDDDASSYDDDGAALGDDDAAGLDDA